MSENNYHNYPDKNVTKKELRESWFPMSSATCDRRLQEAKKIRKFKDIQLKTGANVLVNVRGFYEFLVYRENNRFRV